MSELLRRIVIEKRSLVLALVVALVGNIAAYVLVVHPRGVKSAGAADRAAAAADAVRAAEVELATARALVEGKSRAEEELNAFYQRVLPVDLSAARRMTYASLPALARKTNVRDVASSFVGRDAGRGPGSAFIHRVGGHRPAFRRVCAQCLCAGAGANDFATYPPGGR